MKRAAHTRLLVMAVAVWALFWVLGLPRYYQQYPAWFLALGCALLIPPTFWFGWRSIRGRLPVAFWMSFYFTAPLALLDWLYCGVYLGHGASFLAKYWYLTIFYFLPWLLWMPLGYLPATSAGRSVSE